MSFIVTTANLLKQLALTPAYTASFQYVSRVIASTLTLARHLFWGCRAKFPYFLGPVDQHSFRSFLFHWSQPQVIVSLTCPYHPYRRYNYTQSSSHLILCCHFVYSPSCFDMYKPHKKVCMTSLLATTCGLFVNCRRLYFAIVAPCYHYISISQHFLLRDMYQLLRYAFDGLISYKLTDSWTVR